MEPIVNLTDSCGLQGTLISAQVKGESDVYSFLGVPYAEPPIGDLRFRDPKPITLWNGVRDATQYGPVCPQNFHLLNFLPFSPEVPKLVSEDCLFLNVWTPALDSSSLLPVMFWIHGGGFNSGYGNIYSGLTLASTKNVVVVILNYRLGPLGFLCTNDSSAPGNYGILDQIEALKWVQQHIVHFGGDPDNVTVFGQSSGGMSASLLVLSPLSRGLFKRAIAESGNVFGGDIIACPPEKAAKKLLTELEKAFPDGPSTTATSSEIVQFLRQLPSSDLVKLSAEFFAVIDGRVLPSAPLEVYSSSAQNQVELMVGCNSDEGDLILSLLTKKFGLNRDSLNACIARHVITNFMSTFFQFSNPDRVTEAVIAEYLGGLDSTASSQDVCKVLVEFLGDVLFLIPTIQTANNHSRGSKTFLYYFRHRPSFSRNPEWVLADHGTEVAFLLDIPTSGVKLSDADKQISEQMMSYWANFAKTGNPNGNGLADWPEYNETSKEYIVLEIPVRSETKLKGQRADFWIHQVPQLTLTE